MTTSKYELDLRSALLQYKKEELSVAQFAALVAQRLDELRRWAKVMGEESDSQEIEGLWQCFDFMAEDSSATVDEVDDALEELYEWADSPTSFDDKGQPVRGEIFCRVRNDSTI